MDETTYPLKPERLPVDHLEASRADPSMERRSHPWILIGVSATALAATLYWTIPVLRASGRTFDPTDEGFYLLSYRWWNVDYYHFTGFQLIYGPIFSLLGRNVAHLRVFRLLTVLAVYAVFGWNFGRRVALADRGVPGPQPRVLDRLRDRRARPRRPALCPRRGLGTLDTDWPWTTTLTAAPARLRERFRSLTAATAATAQPAL